MSQYGNKNPWHKLGEAHRVRWWDDFDGIELSDGEVTTYLDRNVAWLLFEFSRGGRDSIPFTAKGPSPAESAGVQAEAKRSPKGRLDAVASVGHCAPIVTARAGRDFLGYRVPPECAWLYIPWGAKEEASCV